MPCLTIRVKKEPGETGVGAALVRLLDFYETESGKLPRVVAVVPTMLAYFSNSPERYEVTEADVVLHGDA